LLRLATLLSKDPCHLPSAPCILPPAH
jgi:hypothetical protein